MQGMHCTTAGISLTATAHTHIRTQQATTHARTHPAQRPQQPHAQYGETGSLGHRKAPMKHHSHGVRQGRAKGVHPLHR